MDEIEITVEEEHEVFQAVRQPFANNQYLTLIDTTLTDYEKEIFSKAKIGTYGAYDNYGALENLPNELAEFLLQFYTAKTDSEVAAGAISRVVYDFLEAYNYETAWFTIRCSSASNFYLVPRWHQDGMFFPDAEFTQQYKFAFTLKGPGTLFSDVSANIKAGINNFLFGTEDKFGIAGNKQPHEMTQEDLERLKEAIIKGESLEVRKKVADIIKDCPKIATTKYTGALFAVGDPEVAIYHSEPHITQERIFFSIVPGTKVQIQQLKNRRLDV